MLTKTLVALCLSIFPSMGSLLAQDIIIKTNGETINCFVEEIGQKEIRYRKGGNPRGPFYTIEVQEVHRIVYENGKVEDFGEMDDAREPEDEETETKPIDHVESDNGTREDKQAIEEHTSDDILQPVRADTNERNPRKSGPEISTTQNTEQNGITFGMFLAGNDDYGGGGLMARYERMLGQRFSTGAVGMLYYAERTDSGDDADATAIIMAGAEGRLYFNPLSKFKVYIGAEVLAASSQVGLLPTGSVGFRFNPKPRFHLYGAAGIGKSSEDFILGKIAGGLGFNF